MISYQYASSYNKTAKTTTTRSFDEAVTITADKPRRRRGAWEVLKAFQKYPARNILSAHQAFGTEYENNIGVNSLSVQNFNRRRL